MFVCQSDDKGKMPVAYSNRFGTSSKSSYLFPIIPLPKVHNLADWDHFFLMSVDSYSKKMELS